LYHTARRRQQQLHNGWLLTAITYGRTVTGKHIVVKGAAHRRDYSGGGNWQTTIVQHAHAASVYHWVVMSVDCATFYYYHYSRLPAAGSGGGAIAVVGFLKYSPPRRRVCISLYLRHRPIN